MKLSLREAVLRRVLLGGAALLVVVQLVPVERSNPPAGEGPVAPANVASILRRSCYDCHSNETVWPWYSQVAPVSWLVAHDVHEGRAELDFSTWSEYPAARRARKLKEVGEQVAEGEMPPWVYLIMHRDAALSAADQEALRAWAGSAAPVP